MINLLYLLCWGRGERPKYPGIRPEPAPEVQPSEAPVREVPMGKPAPTSARKPRKSETPRS
eukprot:14523453-Alexandrium_andersonii.AAC.1